MFVMTKACVSDSGDLSSAAETKGWFDALVVEAFGGGQSPQSLPPRTRLRPRWR